MAESEDAGIEMRVWGPYKRKKDGRSIMVIRRDDGYCTSVSYPKWLMQNRGYDFGPDDTVDHINRDIANDDPDNLRVLDRVAHAQIDVCRVRAVELRCVTCDTLVVRQARNVNTGARRGKAGPFCKPCAGRYGAALQQGRTNRLPPQPTVEHAYYTLKNEGGIKSMPTMTI